MHRALPTGIFPYFDARCSMNKAKQIEDPPPGGPPESGNQDFPRLFFFPK
jgi:hypothetical protein